MSHGEHVWYASQAGFSHFCATVDLLSCCSVEVSTPQKIDLSIICGPNCVHVYPMVWCGEILPSMHRHWYSLWQDADRSLVQNIRICHGLDIIFWFRPKSDNGMSVRIRKKKLASLSIRLWDRFDSWQAWGFSTSKPWPGHKRYQHWGMCLHQSVNKEEMTYDSNFTWRSRNLQRLTKGLPLW